MKWTCPYCNSTFELILQLGKKTIIDSCCGVKTYVTKVSQYDFLTELICENMDKHVWKNDICIKCNLPKSYYGSSSDKNVT
jgi:hypothetical protein